jgi:UDP-2,3-diacylglucosamine hydrolase
MKVSAISDVHVKIPHDEADTLLLRFLNHPLVQSSDYILLLGDIFDLMAGPHPAYLKDFAHLFDAMDTLLKAGKKIYFIEGNHDVHLEALFRRRWKGGEFVPLQHEIVETIDGKTYYFSHGDEHEIDNQSYQRYKKFITSRPLKFVADHLMPYAVLNFIGERASKASRKKGHKSFNEISVRDRFRVGVEAVIQGKYDFIIGGHSHVQDRFELPGGGTYLNNGYALRTKTFILIDNHEVSFPVL